MELVLIVLLNCIFTIVLAQNITIVHPELRRIVGEAALGGMIPTSVIIILAALLRILQIYKQRQTEINNNVNRSQ